MISWGALLSPVALQSSKFGILNFIMKVRTPPVIPWSCTAGQDTPFFCLMSRMFKLVDSKGSGFVQVREPFFPQRSSPVERLPPREPPDVFVSFPNKQLLLRRDI